MQPGLNRAIPMGLLGFLIGAGIVILIRALQGLTPIWDLGVGMSLAAFTTAGFFVWGMGAFSPEMNAHGEEADRLREEAEKNIDKAPPGKLLTGSIWTLAAWTLVFIVAVFGFASIPGGFLLVTTTDPTGSVAISGMVEMDLFGTTVQVSQLVIFAIVVIVLFISLALVAGAVAWIFGGMSVGIYQAKQAAANTGGITSESGVPPAPQGRPAWINRLLTVVLFVGVFIVLYLVFYYVAIGLILPAPNLPGLNLIFPSPATQLMVLSAVNAALFTVLILRPTLVLHFLGRVARGLLSLMRRVPNALQ